MSDSTCPGVVTADGALPCLRQVIKEGKVHMAQFDIHGDSNLVPIDCDLAVAFDNMTENEVKHDMDEDVHIMVAGFMKELNDEVDVTFEKIVSLLSQSNFCEPDSSFSKLNTERFRKKGDRSKFLVRGKPTQKLLTEIRSNLINKVIDEKRVRDDLGLNVEVLGNIITAASSCIDLISNLIGDDVYQEKTLIDLGVLVFPDEDRGYFQTYKIELKAYIDASRDWDPYADEHGLIMSFDSRRFIPRDSIISILSDGTKDKAKAQSIALYTSKPKAKVIKDKTRTPIKWPAVHTADGQAPTVISVLKDAGPALRSFDMKVDGPAPVNCDFSVAFDDLSPTSIRGMGTFTLVMVAGINRTLANASGVTFETMKGLLSGMSILETFGRPIMRADRISKTVTDVHADDDKKEQVAGEVKRWLQKMIGDPEIMEDLQGLLDTRALTHCLVTAGKSISTADLIAGKHEYNSRELVDLTVFRFADDDREYVHLYRLTIQAFTDSTRETLEEVDMCGISGDFEGVKFAPRKSVLEGIRSSTIARITQESVNFYNMKK